MITPGYGAVGHGLAVQVKGAGATGTTIQGNMIGVARNGAGGFPFGNAGAVTGVYIDGASGTQVGGTTTAARNTIANIAFYGVRSLNAPSTQIQGNFFGTNSAGTAAEPTTQDNIRLDSSPNSVIGGPTLVTGQAPGNVVSGSRSGGITISTAGAIGAVIPTTIQGNLVGTDAAGTAALPNQYGVTLVGIEGATVGGSSALTRNVISGNSFDGVELNSTTGNVISGNYIGTDITGAAALGNGRGIYIRGTSSPGKFDTIGGTTLGSGNVISGSNGTQYAGAGDGIVMVEGGFEHRVFGNRIGTTASGTAALPNAANGIETIGGGRMRIGILDDPTGSNTIADNGANGIRARNGGPLIFGNSIHDNGGLGIANDGAAAGTPAMTVTSVTATAGGGTRVQGTLAGVFAANDYTMQAYANPACDPSGAGEGEFYLGSSVAHAVADGTTTFDVVSTVPYVTGRAVVVTVSLQNPFQGLITTSNFSTCKLTGSADLSIALSDAPDPVDQGQQLTYTAVVSNGGPDSALFTKADLALPTDATYAGVTTTQGTCTGSRGSAHCTLGSLAGGASATIVVRVLPLTAGTATASATTQSAVDDPVSGNNSASTTTTVQPATLTPLTFVVNSAGDAPDATIGDGTCQTAAGVCTLRAALEESNLHPSKDTIAFAISGTGVQTIAPASPLPDVGDPVTIDGTTQPGYLDRPLIELNGVALAAPNDGLHVVAGDTDRAGARAQPVPGLADPSLRQRRRRRRRELHRHRGGRLRLCRDRPDRRGARRQHPERADRRHDRDDTGRCVHGRLQRDHARVRRRRSRPRGSGERFRRDRRTRAGERDRPRTQRCERLPVRKRGRPDGRVRQRRARSADRRRDRRGAQHDRQHRVLRRARAERAQPADPGQLLRTNTAGDAAEATTQDNIRLDDSPNSVIGGSTLVPGQAPGNVLAGSRSSGVTISSAGNANPISRRASRGTSSAPTRSVPLRSRTTPTG